jgi:TetR/AcrR family transcriptional repressor of nem operon
VRSPIPGGSQRGTKGAQGGKRERLIAAAAETFYAAGVEKTTLADIAAAAGIPLGNVYYYFKTKDALVQAVVEAHLTEASTMLAAIDDAYPGPASGSRRCSAPSPSKAT